MVNGSWTLLSWTLWKSLQWRHNGRRGVSNNRHHHCLLNRLFRRRSKNIKAPRHWPLCAGNSPVTGEFHAQMASDAENVSIWWRHHIASKGPRITSQEVGWRVGAVIQALKSASKLAMVSYSITIQPRTSYNSERHHWLMQALVLP